MNTTTARPGSAQSRQPRKLAGHGVVRGHVATAISALRDLLPEPWTLDALAEEVHLSRYQQYFNHVQSLWASTPEDTRTALIAAMTEAVEIAGAKLNPGLPMVNKIVELRLIGRQHPVG